MVDRGEEEWQALYDERGGGPVLEELLPLYGVREAPEPGLERFYWRVVEACSGADALARRVLDRLTAKDEGPLLRMPAEVARLFYRRLMAVAREELSGLDLSAAELEVVRGNPLLLPEHVLQPRERFAELGAIAALGHDVAVVGEGTLDRFMRRMLVFKAAYGLHHAEPSPDHARVVALTERALRGIEAFRGTPEIADSDVDLLLHTAAEWLAFRYRDVGDNEKACAAFTRAAACAPDADSEIPCRVMAASCRQDLGDPRPAMEMLERARPLLAGVADPEVRALWDMAYSQLRHELGGDERVGEEAVDPIAGLLSGIMGRWAREDRPPSDEELGRLTEVFHSARRELHEAGDVVGAYKQLMGLLRFVSPLKQERQWLALAAEAEALEPLFDDEEIKLDRRLMVARRSMFTPEGRERAPELFAALWEGVERWQDEEEQLATTGYYLDALGKRRRPSDRGRVMVLVDRVSELFQGLLSGQPTAPARRRIREMFQRPIESAVAVLLTWAELDGQESASGQEALERAWRLVGETRNVELGVSAGKRARDVECDRLEAEFHRMLRDHLLADAPGERWERALARLVERELLLVERERPPGSGFVPDENPSPALLFFQFRELVAERTLVGVSRCRGIYRGFRVEHAEQAVLAPLVRFRDALSDGKEMPSGEWLEGVSVALFHSLLILNDPEQGAPTWRLMPDGALTEMPFELLPDPVEPGSLLGQRFAVTIPLRGNGPGGRPVDWRNGWLGVAGTPPGSAPLPEGEWEVRAIAHGLRAEGVRAKVMVDARATASALCRRLSQAPPAVLHLAVHGTADRQWPEACSLLLMPDAESGEGELLPFRRIVELDLCAVDLVVLSACASSIGGSRRAEGLRGLAWAFLQAGAGQVVASRWPVDDASTQRFMRRFYHHLRDSLPDEALRRSRCDALEMGMPLREVGAWGIWC